MADYFTYFSCVLNVGTAEKAIAALDLFLRLREEDEVLIFTQTGAGFFTEK